MSRARFIASVTGTHDDPFKEELARSALRHGVQEKDILARHKMNFVIPARWEFWAALNLRGWSYADIARRVDRDTTAVRHGVLKHLEAAEAEQPSKPEGRTMTPYEHFSALMRERRKYKRGTPEHSWRTRAARKYVWLMRGVPTLQWGAMQ